VEFLVWPDPETRAPGHVAGYGYAFIEMNPRIQVEHTVTEEVTGIDLVLSQLRVAEGRSLSDLGIRQNSIRINGSAIQCRLTTEDPSDDFRPSTGLILSYRSPGGPGIRLDGAAYAGAEITPFYDSLLVKMTTTGSEFTVAARRARRGLAEFVVRGVASNVTFLQALLASPDFLSGQLTTAFLDEHPELLAAAPGAQLGEAAGLLLRLAETTVNRPFGAASPSMRDPAEFLPAAGEPSRPPQVTSSQVLRDHGPEGLASWLRGRSDVAVTDTTLRDAHQSLLATRVRTMDLVAGAEATGRMLPGLFSIECWGGATFDAALRFLGEDPWDRLERMRSAAPHALTQMLIRGRNAVGYAPYPDVVVRAFVKHARESGMDVFRVFDALNDVSNTRPVIEAAREHGGYAEGAICYTGDLVDPDERTYSLDYYLRIADQYVTAGVHGLCIKDMAGLLRPDAAEILVDSIRSRFGLPLRLHTHDTAGGQMATYLAAIDAGVDGVDCASAPLASGGSQPSLGGLLAALRRTPRDPAVGGGMEVNNAIDLEPYWTAVRDLYAPFEAGQRSPSTSVYRHEIPGGQLSNLRAQAAALGISDFDEVLRAYREANDLLGNPVKVTPSSKVVGDLAVWMVTSGVTKEMLLEHPHDRDLPASVFAFLQGQLGVPEGGFVQPFTGEVLRNYPEATPPAFRQADLDALASPSTIRQALSRLMLPAEASAYEALRMTHGDISRIPTRPFLFGLAPHVTEVINLAPGRRLFVELEAVGDLDVTGRRSVHLRANGQPIAFRVVDTKAPTSVTMRPKAEVGNPAHFAASVPGVVSVLVKIGDTVHPGQRIAVIEAMKMEASVTCTSNGIIGSVCVESGSQVEPGDLIIALEVN
jgi:pyruvate carboxylase